MLLSHFCLSVLFQRAALGVPWGALLGLLKQRRRGHALKSGKPHSSRSQS